jgi:hypothetical protein
MGWTYEEMDAQPKHRIEEAFMFMGVEGEVRKALQK